MKLKLTNVRIAFPDLFDPKQYQGKGDFSYGCQFLVEPDSENYDKIEEAIVEVATAKWGKKAAGHLKEIRPDKKACCWIDGDRRSEYDGFEGMWALTAKRKENKNAPLVLRRDKSVITKDKGEVYGGCFVNATVDIYASETSGVGIRCELQAVQFFEEGTAFGSGAPPNPDDFDDLSDGTEDDDDIKERKPSAKTKRKPADEDDDLY